MIDSRPRGVVGVVRGTFRSFGEDKAPRLAAALSYYTIFSIAPLLVLVIAITGFVIGSNTQIRDQVLGQVQTLVGPQGAQMVNTLITNTSRPRDGIIASVIGVITLFLGATGVYIQLKDALNTVWEVTRKRVGIGGMVKERLAGFVMILVLGFLLLVSLVVSAALSVLYSYFTSLLGNSGVISMVANYAIQVVVITILFGAIFRGVPDVEIHWGDVWVGALVTALLFLVGQFLISLYLSKASPSSTYGAAGSLVIILLWVYYSSMILFLGAEFTKQYALARGSDIVPNANARWLTPVERAHQGIAREKDEEAMKQPEAARQPQASRPAAPQAPQGAVSSIPVSGEEEPDAGQSEDQENNG